MRTFLRFLVFRNSVDTLHVLTCSQSFSAFHCNLGLIAILHSILDERFAVLELKQVDSESAAACHPMEVAFAICSVAVALVVAVVVEVRIVYSEQR